MRITTGQCVLLKEDVSFHIARYPLKALYTSLPADLFLPTRTQLLWEAFSHAAITAQISLVYIYSHACILVYPPLSIVRYSFIQLSELEQRGVNKIVQDSKRQREGFY